MLTPGNSLVPEDLTGWSPPSFETVVREFIDPLTPSHNVNSLAHIDDSERSIELDFFTPQASPLSNNLATIPDQLPQEEHPVLSRPEITPSGQPEGSADSPSPIILTRRKVRRPLIESDESDEEEFDAKKECDGSSNKIFDREEGCKGDDKGRCGSLFVSTQRNGYLPVPVDNEPSCRKEEKSSSIKPNYRGELGSSRSQHFLEKSKSQARLSFVSGNDRTTITLDDSDSEEDLVVKYGLGKRFTPKQPKISIPETPLSRKIYATAPVIKERSTFVKEADKLTELLKSKLNMNECGLPLNTSKMQSGKVQSALAPPLPKSDQPQVPQTPILDLDSEDELPIRTKSSQRRRIMIESSSEDENNKEEQTETGDDDKENLPPLSMVNNKSGKIDGTEDYDHDADVLAKTLEETRITKATSIDLTDFDDYPFSDDEFENKGILIFEGTPSSNKVHKLPPSIDLTTQRSPLHDISNEDDLWYEDMLLPARNVTVRTPKRREPLSPIPLSYISPKKPLVKGISKKDFKRKRQTLAEELYNQYNQKIFKEKLPNNLQIIWSVTLNTTAGRAISKREYVDGEWKYSSKIELSAKVVDDYDKLRNTLAHELCHVAAWVINGVSKPPHGNVFKSWASCFSRNYPDLNITTCHNYQIDYKYQWECTNVACRKVYGRHSKSIDITKHSCGICRGRLRPLQKIKVDGTPYKERAPNRFQIFVKDNFKRIKDLNPHASHAEVMAILGKEYKSTTNEKHGNDFLS